MTSPNPGRLSVVATPIGNLEDLTLRALRILKEADVVLCEDTRHSQKLFAHYGLTSPKLSLHEHNERERFERVRGLLAEGRKVALISDAGTPLVSDPGNRLVAMLREEGFVVEPIPGPSAVIAALSAAGHDLHNGFHFLGFLPEKAGARAKVLDAVERLACPLVCYLAPHDAARLIDELARRWPARRATLARELTKLHEEFLSDTLEGLARRLTATPPRGELTLIVDGAPEVFALPEGVSLSEIVAGLLQQEPDLRSAATRPLAKLLAARLGASVNTLYEVISAVRRTPGE